MTEQQPCPARHPEHGRPPGQPVFCPGHTASIQAALGELQRLAADLTDEHGRRTETPDRDGGVVGHGKTIPTPAEAVDLADELVQWTWWWIGEVAKALGHRGPVIDTTSGLPHHDAVLGEGLTYLMRQAPVALELPELAGWGVGVLRMHHRLRRWLRQDDPVVRLYLPCPGCERPGTLSRPNGGSQVSCEACHRSWPESDYERFVRVLLS